MICPSLHGDLEQPVLEIRGYPAAVYTFRQVHAPPEVPVIAFSGVVTHTLRFAPALAVDGQNAAGEGDLHVVPFYAGELATYHEIFAPGEYVGGGDPGGRVGPPLVLLSPTLGVLPHTGHLAHVVHEPPKRVACPAHLPSAFLAAMLFGVLRRHLLRCHGALPTRHGPVGLGRLGCYAGHPLLAQRSQDGEAQPDQDENERRRRGDGHGLQGQEGRVHRALYRPGQQADRRRSPGEDAPHDDVPRFRMQVALRGEHAHHDRRRIGPTDKEQRDQDDSDERHQPEQRELLEGGEQRRRLVVCGKLREVRRTRELQVYRRRPENGEP